MYLSHYFSLCSTQHDIDHFLVSNSIEPFRYLHFERIHYACKCYWQAETKQSFFSTGFLVKPMTSATTYSSNLNSDDRKKYEEKLMTADGTVLPDLYTLVENWKDIVKLLPGIMWANIYNYLINTPSLYTNENLKAYKLLETYNFFASGHVDHFAHHEINNLSELCFIKTKVIIKLG